MDTLNDKKRQPGKTGNGDGGDEERAFKGTALQRTPPGAENRESGEQGNREVRIVLTRETGVGTSTEEQAFTSAAPEVTMRSVSVGDTVVSDSADERFEESRRKRKRKEKKDSSGEVNDDQDRRETLIANMTTRIKKLLRLVEENPNTLRAIKTGIMELHKEAKGVRKLPKPRNAEVKEAGTDPMPPAKETRSVGTQLALGDVEMEERRKAEETKEKIREAMEGDFDKLAEVMEEAWPEDAFRHTEIVPREEPWSGDGAVLADPKAVEGDREIAALAGRIRGIDQLIRESEGGLEYVVQTARTVSSRHGEQETAERVYHIPVVRGEEGKVDRKATFLKISEWAEREREGEGKLRILPERGADATIVRKMVERAFVGSARKISVHGARVDERTLKKRKPRDETTILVSGTGKSFSEVVRHLRENVNTAGTGAEVRRIRPSAKGDVLVTVASGVAEAEKMKAAIADVVGNTGTVRSWRRAQSALFLTGMDPTASEKEIVGAIVDRTGASEQSVVVRSLRVGRFGDGIALIELPTEPASALCREGFLKVGWVRARVNEKVHLQRCLRCLGLGHRADECREKADRRDCCYRCGEKGHRRAECKAGLNRCFLCKEEGHRPDQLTCPLFRAAVLDERQRRMGAVRTGA